MEKEENIIELTIKDLDFGGINMISLVDDPAIEVDYMVFKNQELNISLARVDEDKRIITGPALIPNKHIVRYNKETNEKFFVFFSEETVKQSSEKYLIDKNNSNVNLDHSTPVNDISIIESWLVNDSKNDKANSLGYDVPKGTWMISMKVNNDTVWNEFIKPGILKGFSIEGSFQQKFNAQIEEVVFEPIEPIFTDDDQLELIEELFEEVEMVELAKKKKQKEVLFAKEWVLQPSIPGFNGAPVPVCDFCTEISRLAPRVKFGSLWTNPNPAYTGKWYQGKLKPKQVHRGCRCTWKRVVVTEKEYKKLK